MLKVFEIVLTANNSQNKPLQIICKVSAPDILTAKIEALKLFKRSSDKPEMKFISYKEI